jgi:cell division transport system permease protein
MSAVFLLIAVLIVFNTVRIGIFIHKEEIGIMKLVGATNWFVKAPFILEMIILSFVAVGIVVLVSYPVLAILESKFALFFGGVQVGLINYFEINGLNIFGTQLMVLIAITVISTMLAMRRYLKV